MNTKFRPSKMSAVKRRKVGVGRCVVGVSLLAAGLRATVERGSLWRH